MPITRKSIMTIEAIQIIEALRFGLKTFNETDSYNESPSIYVIAFNGDQFPLHLDPGGVKKGDIIYVGKTESGIKNIIMGGSLGSVLKKYIKFDSIPGTEKKEGLRDFNFIIENEKILTEWMINNLLVSHLPYSRGRRHLNKLEKEIIYILNPILNLNSNAVNKNGTMIKELREKCRQLAKVKQKELKIL